MRKPGCNELDVQMSDVLCDYCMQEWTEARTMVEGHQGSCICGDCLADAYRALAITEAPIADAPPKCTLCLEVRKEPCWMGSVPGPGGAHACVCRRCVRQSAAVLQKATELGWRKPTAP